MILVDYSQTALSAILSFQRELKGKGEGYAANLIRHVILSSLQNIKKKHGREYGQLVIFLVYMIYYCCVRSTFRL